MGGWGENLAWSASWASRVILGSLLPRGINRDKALPVVRVERNGRETMGRQEERQQEFNRK